MTTVQQVPPAEGAPSPVVAPPAVRASALAAWQLVEDARYRPGRRPRSERRRLLARRAIAARKAALEVGTDLPLD
jgi:hypothetical protein